jgi:hypothetical protein
LYLEGENMAQVTIYIEPALEAKMRQAAQAMNLSQSKWVANIIREKLQNEWPATVQALAGAWQDLPDLEEIRSTEVPDSERESL